MDEKLLHNYGAKYKTNRLFGSGEPKMEFITFKIF